MRNINDSGITIIDSSDVEDGKYKETPITEADLALEDFLDKARAIGSTATLTINRLSSGRNSSEIFCGKFPVDKYDYFDLLSLIQSNWGEGDYRIYCTVKGKKGVLQNTLVSVAPPPINPLHQQSNANSSGENVISTVIKMMQENNERMIALMRPADDSDSMTKALNQMLLMKQVLGGGDKPPSMLGQMKEMAEMMTLMKGLSGDAEPAESGIVKALTAFAPVAAAAVGAMANRAQPVMRQNPMYRHAPQPNQNTGPIVNEHIVPETVVNEPVEKNAMGDYEQAVNNLITLLNTLGPSKILPEDIAETLTQDLTDENALKLQEWVTSPECYTQLLSINGQVADYQQWFLDLIEHVKAQLGLPSLMEHLYSGNDEGELDTEHDAGN